MKDLQEDNVFGSIRQRLGRYKEAPSEELWEKIVATQKKRRPALWLALVGATVAVGIGAVVFFGLEKEQEKRNIVKKLAVEREPVAMTEERAASPEIKASQTTVSKQSIITNTHSAVPVSQSQITKHESPVTNQDSTSSPIIIKPDSTSSPKEVVPPFKKPKSKFQLYLAITPSLSFGKIIPTANDAIIIEGLAHRSPFSMKRFGFAVDVGTQYDLNKFFGFYGGLSFYRQQQQLTYNYYDKDPQVTRIGDTWSFQINRPEYTKTFDYTMTNLGARTGVLVTLKGEKLKHKFGAGISYSHGFARSSGSYNNIQSTYIAYQVFYRNEIRINDRFSWYVEPTFNYSFISKEKLDEPFRLKPYRAGISGGMLYRFK